MRILGINFGHNGTIGVLEDGKIIFVQSEERINRIKNSYGLPTQILEYVINKYGDFDYIVFNFSWPYFFHALKQSNFTPFRYIDDFKKTRPLNCANITKFLLWKYAPYIFSHLWTSRNKKHIDNLNKKLHKERSIYFSKIFNIDESRLIFLDHHTAHALSVAFNLDSNKKYLIFTNDESGDGICATVSIYTNGNLVNLVRISDENSIGALWHNITGFIGLKPLEDEYKIMGLAPYSKMDKARLVANEFHKILMLDKEGKFASSFPTNWSHFFYYDKFLYERFDNLAGGIQLFTEEIVCDWIKYWINKTGIHNIALAGGLFMNVKLNQKIAELPEVESIFIMPSAGDESSVFGCCFYGYKKYCEENNLPFKPQPFTHLYLGFEYTDEEIKKTIDELNLPSKYKIEYFQDIEKKVAELLAKNEIVARFSGPMEFGARALGNRSILANPSNYDNVRIINEMIKQRDFWMPFACSILEEDEHEYIINPKNIYAPYMIITFNTTERGRKELKAGIHPYDFTIRPQIVRKDWNPKYHYLISEFKKLTGIGAVLNTSFNLHGEPLVCSPEDAISTFERSGLKYIALGNYLISKNE
ncbi:MAG: carbamoyltransferase [Candidatus Parcubacteria bacterium]|nr:MAG: carbamoyltransferase [Candidatus Parcubacteria bacterium]